MTRSPWPALIFGSVTAMAKRFLSKAENVKNSVGNALMENTDRSQPVEAGHRSITDIDRSLTVARAFSRCSGKITRNHKRRAMESYF